MYDLVIGRDLLDQVSAFVVTITNRCFYMPRMQQGDFSLHSMPVVSGRAAAPRGHLMHAAALSDTLAFMPACAAVFADVNPAAETEQDAAADTQPSPAVADAATQTDNKPISKSKQRLNRQAVKAETKAAVTADCGPTFRAWGVGVTPVAVLAWLILWPFWWLLCRACDKVERAWRSFFGAAMQPAPREGTTYWRLGRGHRSAAGETIYLQPDANSSGRKPRSVIILRPCVTWSFVASAWTAKMLLFLLMLAAVATTSTQAMQTYQAVTPVSTSLAAQHLMPPLPYSVSHLLAAGLTDHLGSTGNGECFRY
jgi:hypothetical protein